jgi:hypothetical protein
VRPCRLVISFELLMHIGFIFIFQTILTGILPCGEQQMRSSQGFQLGREEIGREGINEGTFF